MAILLTLLSRAMLLGHSPPRTHRSCSTGDAHARHDTTIRCVLHRPYSWEELQTHAVNQSARYAIGEYPGRSPEGNAMYDRYKRWCVEHGRIRNAEYVLRYVRWRGGSALEPSLAPYLLEEGIEHWILWHHPERTKGDMELNGESDARIALLHVEREGGARLDREQIVCFQNVLPLRSIPTIAHSHVFLHVETMSQASQAAVSRLREAWRRRSPWLQEQSRAPGPGTPGGAAPSQ